MEKDRKNLYINIVFILQGIKFKFKIVIKLIIIKFICN